jgi:hypothetical protein
MRMKRIILTLAAAAALAFAGSAAAAISPWVFDPGNTGCPTSSFSAGVLHLAKNCATTTNASAGASITDVSGQTFTSASLTLPNTTQCQGGSPRFNVVTTNGTTNTTFFLGCNNVTPTTNADGTVTYTFNASTIAAAGGQVPVPTGTIVSADVLIDVQGTADLSNITFNGMPESALPSKSQCKHHGWRSFTSPSFKNQGQCIKFGHGSHHGTSMGHGHGHDNGQGEDQQGS